MILNLALKHSYKLILNFELRGVALNCIVLYVKFKLCHSHIVFVYIMMNCLLVLFHSHVYNRTQHTPSHNCCTCVCNSLHLFVKFVSCYWRPYL